MVGKLFYIVWLAPSLWKKKKKKDGMKALMLKQEGGTEPWGDQHHGLDQSGAESFQSSKSWAAECVRSGRRSTMTSARRRGHIAGTLNCGIVWSLF